MAWVFTQSQGVYMPFGSLLHTVYKGIRQKSADKNKLNGGPETDFTFFGKLLCLENPVFLEDLWQ